MFLTGSLTGCEFCFRPNFDLIWSIYLSNGGELQGESGPSGHSHFSLGTVPRLHHLPALLHNFCEHFCLVGAVIVPLAWLDRTWKESKYVWHHPLPACSPWNVEDGVCSLSWSSLKQAWGTWHLLIQGTPMVIIFRCKRKQENSGYFHLIPLLFSLSHRSLFWFMELFPQNNNPAVASPDKKGWINSLAPTKSCWLFHIHSTFWLTTSMCK